MADVDGGGGLVAAAVEETEGVPLEGPVGELGVPLSVTVGEVVVLPLAPAVALTVVDGVPVPSDTVVLVDREADSAGVPVAEAGPVADAEAEAVALPALEDTKWLEVAETVLVCVHTLRRHKMHRITRNAFIE